MIVSYSYTLDLCRARRMTMSMVLSSYRLDMRVHLSLRYLILLIRRAVVLPDKLLFFGFELFGSLFTSLGLHHSQSASLHYVFSKRTSMTVLPVSGSTVILKLSLTPFEFILAPNATLYSHQHHPDVAAIDIHIVV